MSAKTVVIDYGAGNLKSVENALAHLGARYHVTSRPADLEDAQALIFPGVGEAAQSMGELRRTGLDAALLQFLASGRKILGICIGCQVIFERSEERDTRCLGLFAGQVRRFPSGRGLKVPHMGWNTVRFTRAHPVFDGIPQDSSFYFVHSYYPAPEDPAMVAGVTEYGNPFASCLAKDNLVAFQFHLEKSGPLGLKLLSNFLAWDPGASSAGGSNAPAARMGASRA
jgi:imidazole glycerol-phosphate synthase subunit HisH